MESGVRPRGGAHLVPGCDRALPNQAGTCRNGQPVRTGVPASLAGGPMNITVTIREFTPEQRAAAYQWVAELLQRVRAKRLKKAA